MGTLLLENGTLTWLGWTQRFLHYNVPRYSMYSFERVPSSFEMEHKYFESVGNYSLFFVMVMLISVLLITLSVLMLHANIIEYNHTNVFINKVVIFAFGFISFLATIMAFVGFTMVEASLRKVIKEHLQPASDALKECNGHIKQVGDRAFGMLHATRKKLTTSDDNSGNFLQRLADKAKEKLAVPVIDKMLGAEPQVMELKQLLAEIVEIFEQLTTSGESALLILAIYIVFTMFVCLWMASSSFNNAGTGPILCRLSTFVLIIWWIVGGAVMPILLMLADTCHHPVAVLAKICVFLHDDIDPNIIYYYGDCKEPNPIQGHLDKLYEVASYMAGPIAYIAKTIGWVIGDSPAVEALKNASVYMTRLEQHGGCTWSSQQFKIAFSDVCTNMIMGLAMLVLASIIIAIGLTIAVMACIRLREFKGWPEKEKRMFPCPSTCHIHRERTEPVQSCQPSPLEPEKIWPPVQSCQPSPLEPEIIWPPPKQYDRRITCPITCRGHDRAKAAVDLRDTCAKTCRGMIPRKPPPPPAPRPKPIRRNLMIPKQDKAAVCCIEVYKNNECIQEAAICKCHEGADSKTKCDAEKCKENLISKGFLGNCGLYKCRFTKIANKRRRKEKEPQKSKDKKSKGPQKPKDKIPIGPDASKPTEEKKSVVKCGKERCKQTFKSADIKRCQLSKCKKNKNRKMDGVIEVKPPQPPAEPVKPVEPVENKGPVIEKKDVKVKGGDSKNPKLNTKANLSKNPAAGLTIVPPVSTPEEVTSKKGRIFKKVKVK